jgi:hypothetical protein
VNISEIFVVICRLELWDQSFEPNHITNMWAYFALLRFRSLQGNISIFSASLLCLFMLRMLKSMHWSGWRIHSYIIHLIFLYFRTYFNMLHTNKVVLLCFHAFFTPNSYTYMFSYIESCYFVCFHVLLIMMLFYALWDLYLQCSCSKAILFCFHVLIVYDMRDIYSFFVFTMFLKY